MHPALAYFIPANTGPSGAIGYGLFFLYMFYDYLFVAYPALNGQAFNVRRQSIIAAIVIILAFGLIFTDRSVHFSFGWYMYFAFLTVITVIYESHATKRLNQYAEKMAAIKAQRATWRREHSGQYLKPVDLQTLAHMDQNTWLRPVALGLGAPFLFLMIMSGIILQRHLSDIFPIALTLYSIGWLLFIFRHDIHLWRLPQQTEHGAPGNHALR